MVIKDLRILERKIQNFQKENVINERGKQGHTHKSKQDQSQERLSSRKHNTKRQE